MRIVLQRVRRAAVRIEDETVSSIGAGLLALVAIEAGDDAAAARKAADKIAGLRCFPDGAGKMNLDVAAAGGACLVVSQFTLAARLDRGRRPSFERAAPPETARTLVAELTAGLRARGLDVAEGRFGANMQVDLVNDGPVTFVLDLG